MAGKSADLKLFDHPDLIQRLFNPRPERGRSEGDGVFKEINIPTPDGFEIGARFYSAAPEAATILFFHGNGEIVEDYGDIAAIYNRLGINFFPVDYRGYGRSTGQPTISNMLADCHTIFGFFKGFLERGGYDGPVCVMGRSLGSASALEIVAGYPDSVDGLIIESGFAFVVPLLQLIGVNTEKLGIAEDDAVGNHLKITGFSKPTLIIHAELDHIIPFTDGQYLYEKSPSADKSLLKIPGANHNDILAVGLQSYLEAVAQLTGKLRR